MPQYLHRLQQRFRRRRSSSNSSDTVSGLATTCRHLISHLQARHDHSVTAACVIGLAFLPLSLVQALTLEAISDFDNISAGEAPYYIDTGGDRNVLAINAANEAYRDIFARATTTFTGPDGVYSVTITSIGEIDGEGEYRFLVNDEVVGSAVNEPVDTDWGEQYHRFDDIALTTGDVIAVESNAVSNGLIPENDEYAFARGRWRALALEMDTGATTAAASAAPVDLAVLMLYPDNSIKLDDSLMLEFAISNSVSSSSSIATDPRVVISLPEQLRFVSSDTCSPSDNQPDGVTQLGCDLPELGVGENSQFAIEVSVMSAGEATVTATVSSSHPDSITSNNTDSASWTIAAAIPVTGTPDPDPAPTGSSGEAPANSVNEPAESENEPVESTPTETSQATGNSSSGSMGWLYLALVAAFAAGRQRRFQTMQRLRLASRPSAAD